MRKILFRRFSLAIVTVICTLWSSGLWAAPNDPSAADYSGHKGKTIYVSKLGDNSDGSSWEKAFHTIQAGLQAVPDDQGGHQVIVRPDTYIEANLYSGHAGAKGSYNLIVGDRDGKLGSGATGWVVLDSSCPGLAVRKDYDQQKQFPDYIPAWKIIESDLPETGFKCCDYWGAVLCNPGRSTDDWDRWIWRNFYSTGSEGGGWVMTNHQEGQPLSGVMEDCVGIGRFSGMCAAHYTARPDEPIVCRRCYFACLDWWGDAGGVYVTARETSMPDYPDAVFEDCTIVSPDNCLQVASPTFTWYTRVKFKNCRLISLNFSQPCGTPGSGIICCDIDGKYLHVDLEDCLLMGYKVFGRMGAAQGGQGSGTADPSYTLKGKVQAYVQYEQPTPEGFERLGLWPVDAFYHVAPPKPFDKNAP